MTNRELKTTFEDMFFANTSSDDAGTSYNFDGFDTIEFPVCHGGCLRIDQVACNTHPTPRR